MAELVLTIKAVDEGATDTMSKLKEYAQEFVKGFNEGSQQATQSMKNMDEAAKSAVPSILTLNQAWELFDKVATKVGQAWDMVVQGFNFLVEFMLMAFNCHL